jgi:hypothetical protein
MPIAQSSHVQEYSFNPETGQVVIQFVNGAVYRGDMEQTEYDAFHQSGSKGSYVQNNLRGRLTMVAPPDQKTRRRG